MTGLPLAHAGHWLADSAYVVPVIVIVVWISIRALLDKRADKREAASGGPATPDREPGPPE